MTCTVCGEGVPASARVPLCMVHYREHYAECQRRYEERRRARRTATVVEQTIRRDVTRRPVVTRRRRAPGMRSAVVPPASRPAVKPAEGEVTRMVCPLCGETVSTWEWGHKGDRHRVVSFYLGNSYRFVECTAGDGIRGCWCDADGRRVEGKPWAK